MCESCDRVNAVLTPKDIHVVQTIFGFFLSHVVDSVSPETGAAFNFEDLRDLLLRHVTDADAREIILSDDDTARWVCLGAMAAFEAFSQHTEKARATVLAELTEDLSVVRSAMQEADGATASGH